MPTACASDLCFIDKETVHQQIEEIKAAGIENIMALRGDIPADMDLSHQETWAYHHAIDLIRELKESGADFCIGGACYPEKHPESAQSEGGHSFP